MISVTVETEIGLRFLYMISDQCDSEIRECYESQELMISVTVETEIGLRFIMYVISVTVGSESRIKAKFMISVTMR